MHVKVIIKCSKVNALHVLKMQMHAQKLDQHNVQLVIIIMMEHVLHAQIQMELKLVHQQLQH